MALSSWKVLIFLSQSFFSAWSTLVWPTHGRIKNNTIYDIMWDEKLGQNWSQLSLTFVDTQLRFCVTSQLYFSIDYLVIIIIIIRIIWNNVLDGIIRWKETSNWSTFFLSFPLLFWPLLFSFIFSQLNYNLKSFFLLLMKNHSQCLPNNDIYTYYYSYYFLLLLFFIIFLFLSFHFHNNFHFQFVLQHFPWIIGQKSLESRKFIQILSPFPFSFSKFIIKFWRIDRECINSALNINNIRSLNFREKIVSFGSQMVFKDDLKWISSQSFLQNKKYQWL